MLELLKGNFLTRSAQGFKSKAPTEEDLLISEQGKFNIKAEEGKNGNEALQDIRGV